MSDVRTQDEVYAEVDETMAARIAELPSLEDEEVAHITADNLLCMMLQKVGFPKTVKAFKELTKYYSCLLVALLLTSTAAAAELRHIRTLDGDTLVADIALGFDVVLAQQTIRIHNYDAWETSYRRQTIQYATDEMAKGALAKAALEKLLGSASKVTVQEVAGRDPYGRRLLDVYADGVNVAEPLRAAGHERTIKPPVSSAKTSN